MGLVNGKVDLQNDYHNWKKLFLKEENKLREIFNDIALTIEHVGSTSVEGLLAKPIIDILVGVKRIEDVNKIVNKLRENYTIKNNNDVGEILLIKENDKETSCLIHILEIGSERYKNMILFRDILINNPTIKKEYERLKIELKEKHLYNREMYTKSKHNFNEKVINTNN